MGPFGSTAMGDIVKEGGTTVLWMTVVARSGLSSARHGLSEPLTFETLAKLSYRRSLFMTVTDALALQLPSPWPFIALSRHSSQYSLAMLSTSDCSSERTASNSRLGADVEGLKSQSIKTPASLRRILRYSVGVFVGLTDRFRVCSFLSLRVSRLREFIVGMEYVWGCIFASRYSCGVIRDSSALAPKGTARSQPITAAHFAVVGVVCVEDNERYRYFGVASHAAGSISERARFIEVLRSEQYERVRCRCRQWVVIALVS